MKPKFYPLLQRCVEEGVARGLRQASKHTDSPSQDLVAASVEQAVMTEIHEWFDFDKEQI